MTTLQTDRLTLRMLRQADFAAYAEMCANPEVMRYIGDGQTLARPLAWRNLAMMVGHWSLRGYGLWAAEERSSWVLVGRIGFWNPEGWPGFELGWMLRRASWGRGYATEGARALIRKGFAELGVQRVYATTYQDNLASRRVMEKAGLTLVRTYRMTLADLHATDTYHTTSEDLWDGDDVEYALEKAVWERQEAAEAQPAARPLGDHEGP